MNEKKEQLSTVSQEDHTRRIEAAPESWRRMILDKSVNIKWPKDYGNLGLDQSNNTDLKRINTGDKKR